MSLSEAWRAEAANWLRWVDAGGFDPHWRWARPALLELLPPRGVRHSTLGVARGV